jgi:anti-anti-sigma factor
MFEIDVGEEGVIAFRGRLDTAQAQRARAFIDARPGASVFDFAELDYISSAGLGVLLVAQKRLMRSGGSLRLINVNKHIHDVFHYSGFLKLFTIERLSE